MPEFRDDPPPTEQGRTAVIQREAGLPAVSFWFSRPPQSLCVEGDEAQDKRHQRQVPEQPDIVPSLKVQQPGFLLVKPVQILDGPFIKSSKRE